MSTDDIELARTGSSTDPSRAAVARFVQRVIETRDRSATPTSRRCGGRIHRRGDPRDRHVAVVFLLTNYLNNVNQTVVDIPAVDGQAA